MKTLIKTLSKKSGKPEDEVKAAYETALAAVSKGNPELDKGGQKFYKLLIGELRNMLSIKSENEGADIGGIKYGDVSPGTTAGLTSYHKQKRKVKRRVNEAFSKLSGLSRADLAAYGVLCDEGSELSVTMIETAISQDQLKESVSQVVIGESVDTRGSEALQYLDSSIKQAIDDKQNFANFVETFVSHMFDAKNLNEEGLEYPGYDLSDGELLVSVKSSTSRHTASEAYRNSNSIKSSALILSTMYRMDHEVFRKHSSFKDISDLLEMKNDILEFAQEQKSKVSFAISFINNNNEFCIHTTNPIAESTVLEHCFDTIENAKGKARSKFFASFNKLVEFCGGDEVTTVKLMDESEYSTLRDNIIETISNIKDYDLMRKISLLLK